jgi:hypothetical protein
MSVTAVQSSALPFYVATDSGYSNVRMIVCKKSLNFTGTTTVNTEDTDCGPIVGLGSNGWVFSFEGVANTTPDIGTQESYEQLLKWWNAQTLLYVRWNYPDSGGSDFTHKGAAYITSITSAVAQGAAMNFTIEFTGQGTLTTE